MMPVGARRMKSRHGLRVIDGTKGVTVCVCACDCCWSRQSFKPVLILKVWSLYLINRISFHQTSFPYAGRAWPFRYLHIKKSAICIKHTSDGFLNSGHVRFISAAGFQFVDNNWLCISTMMSLVLLPLCAHAFSSVPAGAPQLISKASTVDLFWIWSWARMLKWSYCKCRQCSFISTREFSHVHPAEYNAPSSQKLWWTPQ